ncbi:lipopolysaccharide biosynthesis protein, partial [Acinetobacter baumannii]|nr:lipopolysaccharide biosynthesis protein [Acinetobacter baumannii]
EISKKIWRKFPTQKAYLITTLLLVLSVINVFMSNKYYISIIMWFFALIIGFYLFRNPLSLIFNLIKRRSFG